MVDFYGGRLAFVKMLGSSIQSFAFSYFCVCFWAIGIYKTCSPLVLLVRHRVWLPVVNPRSDRDVGSESGYTVKVNLRSGPEFTAYPEFTVRNNSRSDLEFTVLLVRLV